jgi:hypothetical protein
MGDDQFSPVVSNPTPEYYPLRPYAGAGARPGVGRSIDPQPKDSHGKVD